MSTGAAPHSEPTLDGRDPAAVRNARQEAQNVVGDRFTPRVLEPSPPAVTDEWFADDPLASPVEGGRTLTPIPGRGTTWDAWLRDRPERAPWVSARWLGAYARLGSPPPAFLETRHALHRLAVYVISAARRRVNGKIGLRFTYRGFGTPFFGADEQVRVAGTSLVRQQSGTAKAEPISTIARAAAFGFGDAPDVTWAERFDVPRLGDPDEQLPIDDAAAAFLADWYGFAFSVLEELRADAESVDASRVQLWPEHFDAGLDCLPDDQQRRATYGASPGDQHMPEPYLYVTPWRFEDVPPDDSWNAAAFHGAIVPLSQLAGADDQRDAALAFFRRLRNLLAR